METDEGRVVLIAPTERHPLTTLGPHSSLPERYGADILFAVKGKWVGIQRKEIADLIASVHDGRLAREMSMMKSLALGVLIVEGKLQWTMDGELLTKGYGKNWTRAHHQGLLWSVQQKGYWVAFTDDAHGTVDAAEMLESWLRKDKHQSLDRRPGPDSMWGTPGNEDFQRHMVMGLPGVGVELAERIIKELGVPFQWRVTEEDLMRVSGIGKKKAQAMLKVLG